MPPVNTKKIELKETDIAVALLKGGLTWDETVAVMSNIKFDKAYWDGSKIVKVK